jgi:hypothetical protein
MWVEVETKNRILLRSGLTASQNIILSERPQQIKQKQVNSYEWSSQQEHRFKGPALFTISTRRSFIEAPDQL